MIAEGAAAAGKSRIGSVFNGVPRQFQQSCQTCCLFIGSIFGFWSGNRIRGGQTILPFTRPAKGYMTAGIPYTGPTWKIPCLFRKRPPAGSFPCSGVGTPSGRSRVPFLAMPVSTAQINPGQISNSAAPGALYHKDAGASGVRSHAGAWERSSEAGNPEIISQPPFLTPARRGKSPASSANVRQLKGHYEEH